MGRVVEQALDGRLDISAINKGKLVKAAVLVGDGGGEHYLDVAYVSGGIVANEIDSTNVKVIKGLVKELKVIVEGGVVKVLSTLFVIYLWVWEK